MAAEECVMNRSIIILGAGGHAKVILDACLCAGISVKGFLVKDPTPHETIHSVPVLGEDICLNDANFVKSNEFIIGVGDLATRETLIRRVLSAGGIFAAIAHPKATVSPRASVMPGTFINAGAVVNIDASIGGHCIINTNASIDHDCILGDNVHICPGVVLAGNVSVAANSFIGSGAIIGPNRTIGTGSIVGAGHTILSDLPEKSVILRK
jgi:sugar O-acyltransferase (sialic acid O-acetyltransferase NeuD family)